MKKSVLAIIIAVIALGLIGYVVFANNGDSKDQPAVSNETADSAHATDETADAPAASTENQASQQEGSLAAGVTVSIKSFTFSPGKITVRQGTKVTWTNKDGVRHDVTPDTETAEFKASGLLSEGSSYSVTFDTPGTYTYHCSPHPYMKGTVEVTE